MSLLSLNDIEVSFETGAGRVLAVRGVSLNIGVGETVGLVGESGCGNSALGKAIMRLVPLSSGAIEVDGSDVASSTRWIFRECGSPFK